jgi:hypothetical protein
MLHLSEVTINKLAMHLVGNKLREEEIRIASGIIPTGDAVNELLLKYFLSPFKSNEFYHLFHEDGLQLNEVYNYVEQIFENPENLYIQSVKLAKHLYENSTHPKIKGGEFYVVYLNGCEFEGKIYDAVGLFKSEIKDTFLKVFPSGDNFNIDYEDGINIKSLDKGCLIINTEKEKGYLVAVVDNLSRAGEAQFWRDHFLQLKQREDNYFLTENVMRMCHQFVVDKLPEKFEITRADQVDLLNKSAKFLKEQDEFDIESFTNEIFKQPEIKDTFNQFKDEYQEEMDFELNQSFKIADEAVKRQSRFFKSVIKLDKNFHIYIHGNKERVLKGYDEKRGMHFYQLFFESEN